MRVLGHASGPCVSSLIKSWLGSLPGDVWEAVRDDLNAQIASGDMSNVQPAELVTRLPVCHRLLVAPAPPTTSQLVLSLLSQRLTGARVRHCRLGVRHDGQSGLA